MNTEKVIDIVNNELINQLNSGRIACEHGQYICIDMFNDTISFTGTLREVSDVTFRAEGEIQCYNGNTGNGVTIDFRSEKFTVDCVTDEYEYNGVSRADFY